MDAARWARVQTLFHDAAELTPPDRREFLETQCTDDPSLVDDALALLAEDERGDSLLDRGIGAAADSVLGKSGEHGVPGQRLGPYRLTRMLGEGGMGVVYHAEREDLGTVAAIKVLRDAWLSPARRERFASEQRTLAQLNHPFIARLYDAGSLADGTPWIVMEYVEGTPLTEYCRAHATSVVGRVRLFRDVCEAVQHAHRHLVVHRDLKPSNILVGNDGIVKLLDFGIAKQLDGLEARKDRTRTGLRLLTPAYAAPEQIRGGRIGTYTDVYALGVILYELLVGHLPFEPGDKIDELEAALTDREAERPSLASRKNPAAARGDPAGQPLRPAEWSDLDVLCLTAMHRDPQRRYATVDALMRDVDHFLNGEPLEARPDSLTVSRRQVRAPQPRGGAGGGRRRRACRGIGRVLHRAARPRAQRRGRAGRTCATHPTLHARPIPGRRQGRGPGGQPPRRDVARPRARAGTHARRRAGGAGRVVRDARRASISTLASCRAPIRCCDSRSTAGGRCSAPPTRTSPRRSSRSATCASTRRSSRTRSV